MLLICQLYTIHLYHIITNVILRTMLSISRLHTMNLYNQQYYEQIG